ncbi:MAG: sulfate adenylyltransferase subunit CysN [Proteobacteria bacterium]|nr:sulfate adenylyltransferase subunit CysN [Pseudomonadota bacterium]
MNAAAPILPGSAIAPLRAPAGRPASLLRFLTCGSVDDGKSTLIGRLLFEADAVPEDQLAALDRDSEKLGTLGGGRDYALLVDGLAAEREQGITIDVAYRYFATKKRAFIVADTPGHEQYTRNMATGASTADLAILLIDARKGLLTQTRRHAFIASMLGIRHALVAVNKMDLVGYSRETFEAIAADFQTLAKGLAFSGITIVPVSAREGDNIATRSSAMPWYSGPSLLELLETVEVAPETEGPFRFSVQWVNRPDQDFRGFAGVIHSGTLHPGDAIRVLPSGTKSRIARIVTADGDKDEAIAGEVPTLVLSDEIDVSRGDVITRESDALLARREITARLLWMGEEALKPGAHYVLRLASQQANARLDALHHAIDINGYGIVEAESIAMNGIGLVTLELDRAIVATNYAVNRELGSFILIDRLTNATVALGLIDAGAPRGLPAPEIPTRTLTRLLGRFARWGGGSNEGHKRSIAKAISWRVTGTLDTFLLSYLFTASVKIAAAIGATEVITKIVLYYFHERAWAKSRFGLKDRPAGHTDGAGI